MRIGINEVSGKTRTGIKEVSGKTRTGKSPEENTPEKKKNLSEWNRTGIKKTNPRKKWSWFIGLYFQGPIKR